MTDSPCNILLVEDDTDLRESILRYLALAGLQAKGAASAKEFYLRLDQASFDVVILDIGLPDQSGFVLADYLRQNTGSGIIILTAHSAIQEKVQGYEAGADLYLVKPIEMEELSAAIKSMASRRTVKLDEPRETPNLWALGQVHQCHVKHHHEGGDCQPGPFGWPGSRGRRAIGR